MKTTRVKDLVIDSVNKPVVSVCVVSYQHKDYIEQCLEGILMQQVNFPIEIIIHDDASTDGTEDIIQAYEKKYSPALIKTIYQTENQYSKGVKPMIDLVYPRVIGKYIALCDGDDYWTDPYKLQKQFDFLEANDDYGMVHTDSFFEFTNQSKTITRSNKFRGINFYTDESNQFENILNGSYLITTCTALFRTKFLENIDFYDLNKFKSGDTFLFLSISLLSKIKYLNEVTTVRRFLKESATQSSNVYKKIEFKKSGYELVKYFAKKHKTLSISSKKKIHITFNRALYDLAIEANDTKLSQKYYNILKTYNAILSLREKLAFMILYISGQNGLFILNKSKKILRSIKYRCIIS